MGFDHIIRAHVWDIRAPHIPCTGTHWSPWHAEAFPLGSRGRGIRALAGLLPLAVQSKKITMDPHITSLCPVWYVWHVFYSHTTGSITVSHQLGCVLGTIPKLPKDTFSPVLPMWNGLKHINWTAWCILGVNSYLFNTSSSTTVVLKADSVHSEV